MLPVEIREKRQEKLKKLAEEHYITWNPDEGAESTMDEDVQLYFLPFGDEERKVVKQYAVVTVGGGSANHCIYADYDELNDAFEGAIENINDSTFPESPVEIVDLDGGEKWEPNWDSLRWKVVGR